MFMIFVQLVNWAVCGWFCSVLLLVILNVISDFPFPAARGIAVFPFPAARGTVVDVGGSWLSAITSLFSESSSWSTTAVCGLALIWLPKLIGGRFEPPTSGLEEESWSDLLPKLESLKESWYPIWKVVDVELDADDEGLKKGDEDGDNFPIIRPFSVRIFGGWIAGGLTSSRSFWLFFAFINSAASALDMFSCFFHFVRRFWNQIFTWNW